MGVVRKGVEVIRDPKKARVLVDPMRREVVRLLSERPMTENGLAEALGLSDPSVGHHLKILRRSGLIRIAKREVEEHGIVQKFYETNAIVYVIDDRRMPLEIERYFMPVSIERARAMIAAFSVRKAEIVAIRAKDLEEFAKILNSAIAEIAPRYAKDWEGDREELINRVYREALNYLLKEPNLLPESTRRLLIHVHKSRQFAS
jgi:DNA-binding transcriptional ArsR family regulator